MLHPLKNPRVPVLGLFRFLGGCLAGGWSVCTVHPVAAQDIRTACEAGLTAAAEVVGIAGDVAVTTVSGTQLSLDLGAVVCPGDRIRTGTYSTVELRFSEANTTTGASSNSTLLIPNGPDASASLGILSGMVHFLSSVREVFTFRTPYVNAGIDGTEATIIVDGPARDTLILLREGSLDLSDLRRGDDRLTLAPGEGAFASSARFLGPATLENVPERFRPFLVRPDSATDFAVYYPAILLSTGVQATAVRNAARALAGGDPGRADALLSGTTLTPRDRAAALAIQSISAVYRNDIERGAELARQAIAANPELGAGHIAQSYVLQAQGQVDAAVEAAERATSVAPGDAYAWARLAELALTTGDYRRADRAVRQSLAIEETWLARTVQGFSHLAAARYVDAQTAFERAIVLESTAPLPRFGLGLTKIRRGKLTEGRMDIETAVALDPRRAALRTWLGRVYSTEFGSTKAEAQYDIAVAEDPEDPTPDLFAALERFAENDPIGALQRIEVAMAKGEGRSTVRGRAGLGEDLAVRGAALARVYDTLGFDALARATGARAAEADPTNPEVHFFLSDAYRGRPNFEVTQSSELLLGQLLSPPSRRLVQPRLAENNLGLLAGSGPARPTFAEFSPLIEGNGISAAATGLVATQDSQGGEASVAVLSGPVSFSFGQYVQTTDGFVANNDVRHRISNVQAYAQVGPQLTFFGEALRRETEQGDRVIEFGRDIEPFLSDEFDRESLRAGFHYQIAPDHDLIAVATWADMNSDLSDCSAFPDVSVLADLTSEEEGYDVQARYFGRFGAMHATVGGRFSRTERKDNDRADFLLNLPDPCDPGAPPLGSIDQTIDDTVRYEGGFAYLTSEHFEGVTATVGLSVDDFSRDGYDKTEVNPKFGLELALSDAVGLRLAYAEVLKAPLIKDTTVDKTMIAGFPQFFDDIDGATSRMAAMGLDARPLPWLWVGAEGMRRWIDSPIITTDVSAGPSLEIEKTTETTVLAYVNATPGPQWAVSAELQHQSFRLEERASDLPDAVDTTTLPLTVSWFGTNGLFGTVEAAYLRQSVRATGGSSRRSEEDVLLGASVGYRLPNRRGIIALEAANLLDSDLDIRDPAFSSPRPRGLSFARDRSISLTATFALGG